MQEHHAGGELRRWDAEGLSLLLRPDTGAWIVVEGTGAEALELYLGGAQPGEIAASLSLGYGIPRERAEADVAAYLSNVKAAGFLRPAPLPRVVPTYHSLQALAVHVTGRCPLQCRHCYVSPAAAHATDPPIALLVSAVEQARALGATSFKLTGGDPLSRPEVLDALAGPTEKAEVTVLTSGVGPYEDLRRLVIGRGWRLQVSLDGPDAQTHDAYRGIGAHALVAANLDALAQDGLGSKVTLSVCLSRVNRGCIEEIIQRAIAWGLAGVLVVRVSHHGEAVKHWSEFALSSEEWAETYSHLADIHARYWKRIRLTGFVADYLLGCLKHPPTRGCRLGQSAMVDLDGRLYPCVLMAQPEHCLGDLRRDRLADCLAPERLAGLQTQCDGRLLPGGVCGDCDWRMVCRGACPGWPMTQERTLEATDDLCELRRELLPKLILQTAQRENHCPPREGLR